MIRSSTVELCPVRAGRHVAVRQRRDQQRVNLADRELGGEDLARARGPRLRSARRCGAPPSVHNVGSPKPCVTQVAGAVERVEPGHGEGRRRSRCRAAMRRSRASRRAQAQAGQPRRPERRPPASAPTAPATQPRAAIGPAHLPLWRSSPGQGNQRGTAQPVERRPATSTKRPFPCTALTRPAASNTAKPCRAVPRDTPYRRISSASDGTR